MANHPEPDRTIDPTRHFMAVMRDTVGQEKALELLDALFEARWEIVSRRAVDEILKSGGLTDTQIQELNNASNK